VNPGNLLFDEQFILKFLVVELLFLIP